MDTLTLFVFIVAIVLGIGIGKYLVVYFGLIGWIIGFIVGFLVIIGIAKLIPYIICKIFYKDRK